MTKQTAKRLTALALCLAMGLSLLPAPALAAELPEESAAQAEAEESSAGEAAQEAEEGSAEAEASAEEAAPTGGDSSASQSAEAEAQETDPADGAESAEPETETEWVEVDEPTEVTDFVWDNWSDDYFSEAVVDPDRERVTVDGEKTAVEDAFGEAAEEAEILESASAAEEYFEETTYEAERQSDGTVTVTAPYQTCRVVVNAASLAEDYGAETILHYEDCDEYILQFPDEESTQAAYEKISARYGESCYLDEVLLAEDVLTEDDASAYTAYSWGADYMGMTELKNSTAVSGTVTVAILDTGCDVDNWFFEGRTFSELSYDFPNKTAGIDGMEDNAGSTSTTGHGTHVAGIITDCTPENVELMILRVFNDEGSCTSSTVKSALDYAAENGADVINVSLGSYTFKDATKTAWDEDLQAIQAQGTVVVCAAGNEASAVMYPASSEYTVAVSSINQDGTLSSFSCYGESIDFCAPGTSIVSAKNGGASGETTSKKGTSMSSPHVAAAFAWLKLLHPEADYEELYQLAQESAIDLGTTGKDDQFGWGYLYLGNEQKISCTLSETSYTYTGSAYTPAVTVVRGLTTLEEGTDYTVAYSDNVEPGTASVTVTMTKGQHEETAYFTILKRKPTISVSLAETTLYVGGTAQLSASTTSEGALSYSTNHFDVADVDGSGLITAYSEGRVTLCVTAAETDHDEAVSGFVRVEVKRPDTPKLTSVTNAASGVVVKWGKVTGAVKYRVFRRVGSGKWVKVGDTTSTSYTDKTAKSGTTYTYTVRCLSADGTFYTSGYNAAGKTICRLSSVTLSSVKNSGKKKIKVKWKKNTTGTGYKIQYSTNKNFSGAKTVTVSKNKTTSKTISKLTKKKTYYVRIRSYKKVGKTTYYSAWSGTRSVKVKK